MFSTDFIFGQQENIVDNKKCQVGFGFKQNTNENLTCKYIGMLDGFQRPSEARLSFVDPQIGLF